MHCQFARCHHKKKIQILYQAVRTETLFYILKHSSFDIEDLDVTKGNGYDLIFYKATAEVSDKILMVLLF